MSREGQVNPTAEEKWEILREGLRSGNVAGVCRKHGVSPLRWYEWKYEAEQRAKAAAEEGGPAGAQKERTEPPAMTRGRRRLSLRILRYALGE